MVFKSATRVPRVLHSTPHAPHSWVPMICYCWTSITCSNNFRL